MFESNKKSKDVTEKEGTAEDIIESREQLGDRILQASRETYSDEVKRFEREISFFENMKDLAGTIALPGTLYFAGKFFGLDLENVGVDVPKGVEAALSVSWFVGMLGISSASVVVYNFKKN